jgi:hypothetical protein
VKTLSRVDESRTRGFTKRARKRRAGIPDLDAFVTFQCVRIWAFGSLSLRVWTGRKHCDGMATKRRSARVEGMGLGLRLIHAQQNEMQNQTDFQENPSKVL